MKLTILGTGTATPSLQRASSSYLLSTTWGEILVDVGPSVVRRLLEYGYSTNDIDLVALTHFHPDHTADLATLLFASNYGDVRRAKPLILLGGSGIERFFRNLVRLYRWVAPTHYDFSIKSLPAGEWELGPVSITTCRSNHNPESIGLRVADGGKSVVFTGDTGFSRNIATLASGTDVLVSECSFPERKVRGHLNLSALQKIVRQAKPRRVILAHLYPDWDTSQRALEAPLHLGVDGLELQV
jgi:ribonuclease BN (tRNA processing enzyme)